MYYSKNIARELRLNVHSSWSYCLRKCDLVQFGSHVSSFGINMLLTSLGRKDRDSFQVSPQNWHLCMKVHDLASQNSLILTFTFLSTLNVVRTDYVTGVTSTVRCILHRHFTLDCWFFVKELERKDGWGIMVTSGSLWRKGCIFADLILVRLEWHRDSLRCQLFMTAWLGFQSHERQ